MRPDSNGTPDRSEFPNPPARRSSGRYSTRPDDRDRLNDERRSHQSEREAGSAGCDQSSRTAEPEQGRPKTALVAQRVNALAGALTELKGRLRAALAGELAGAAGAAVRDILLVALIDRIPSAPHPPGQPLGESGGPDSWDDASRVESHASQPAGACRRAGREEKGRGVRPVPVVAAAVGVSVGRWWIARKGSVGAAVGAGAAAAALGLAGGPLTSAILAVLTAASDALVAEATLAGR